MISLAVVLVFGATFYLSGSASYFDLNLIIAAAAVQPINAISSILIAYRLSLLTGGEAQFMSSFKAQGLAAIFLFILPVRTSELIKPLYLMERDNVRPASAFAAVATERAIDVAIVAAAVCGLVLVTGSSSFQEALPWLLLLLFVMFALALIASIKPQWIRGCFTILPSAKAREMLIVLFDQCRENLVPKRLVPAFALGAAAWFFSFLTAFLFITLSSSRSISLTQVVTVFLVGTAGFAINITPGSAGTFEVATVGVLNYFGLPLSEALALSIGMRVSSQSASLLVGVYVLTRERIGLRSFASKALGYIRESSENRSGSLAE